MKSSLKRLRRQQAVNSAFFAVALLAVAIMAWRIRGPSPMLVVLASCVLGALLAYGAAVDISRRIIPDTSSLGLLAAGLVFTLVASPDRLPIHFLAAVSAGGLLFLAAAAYRHARGRDGLGGGDVKLFAAAGAWLGFEPLPQILLLASLSAIIGMLAVSLFRGRRHLNRRLAFGPHLAMLIWVSWQFGTILI